MSILNKYDKLTADRVIEEDFRQREVLPLLDELAESINKPLKRFFSKRNKRITGMYLYGPVGSGKTFLMDLFYENISMQKKARFHFHEFMQQVDLELRQLQGRKNPMKIIADNLVKTTKLLCLDEFMIQDIVYAMMWLELLLCIAEKDLTLVITSNIRPDDLYPNGIQRNRFLPAISLLKSHCQVIQLFSQRDFRLGREARLASYLYPINAENEALFSQQFSHLAPEAANNGVLEVQKRLIPYIKCGQEAVWFDFNILCNLPRSQLDYLEIADHYQAVFLSNIPKLEERHTVHIILFIHLVDVLYDRGIRLILLAQVKLEDLYLQGEMLNTFQRTLSRLHEMQSMDYSRRHPKRGSAYFMR